MGERPLPGPGELAWTDEDRDLALAYQDEQDATCPGCGHPLDESTNADNADAYDVTVSVCHGCAARERAAKDARDDRDAPLGLRIGTVLDPELRWR
jgi:hypothetical protein